MLEKCPYSLEYTEDGYVYEIIYHGYEHLIPEAFIREYTKPKERRTTFIAPTGLVQFSVPKKDAQMVSQIKDVYEKTGVLTFTTESKEQRIIIKQIRPLEKLLLHPSEGPLKFVCSELLKRVLNTLDLQYEALGTTSEEYTLKVVLGSSKEQVKERILGSLIHINCTSTEIMHYAQLFNLPLVQGCITLNLPVYLCYWKDYKSALEHYLQLLEENTDISVVDQINESSCLNSSAEYLKFLRALGFKSFDFKTLGCCNCQNSVRLLNPLRSVTTYCREPFSCFLRDKQYKESSGYYIKGPNLYIWSSKRDYYPLLKSALNVYLTDLWVDLRDPLEPSTFPKALLEVKSPEWPSLNRIRSKAQNSCKGHVLQNQTSMLIHLNIL